MTIQYYIKDVYGLPCMYIANAEQANAIRKLTGRKTISKSDIQALNSLGLDFQEITRSEAGKEAIPWNG